MADEETTVTETAKKAKPKKKTRELERSTIGFPYRDLNLGITVAKAMLDAGGVALTTEQLAGVLGLQAGSGNFVVKVATARIFGLISNAQGKYELTDLGFEIVDQDDKRQRAARAQAFLNVPLYRRTYDEFRGKQLPPRPGLEQAFVRFGVAPKQKTNARLAFDKSAEQAGFFSAGPDRLIEPIMGAVPTSRPSRPGADERVEEDVEGDRTPASETSGLHPFVRGLIEALPEPGTNWTIEGRAKWLQAAANNFDLMYKGSGEITVQAKPAPESK